jgi:hypothetical protein
MPAEDDNVDDGGFVYVNGTSWSSPQFAAVMAETYQYCHLSAGIANPAAIPYYVASVYPATYIDVISGSDQFQGTSPFYLAKAGYDDASGFGVPHGMAFANTVCPSGVKAPGLLLRSTLAMSNAPQQQRAAQVLDITPRAGGLTDIGQRSAIALTTVHIVLQAESDRQAVESALQQAGFTIDRRFEYERIVKAQAPSATVEAFFRTRMHDVAQPGYGTRYLPTTQVALPDSIASHVVTVSLDNVVTRHVLSHRSFRLSF